MVRARNARLVFSSVLKFSQRQLRDQYLFKSQLILHTILLGTGKRACNPFNSKRLKRLKRRSGICIASAARVRAITRTRNEYVYVHMYAYRLYRRQFPLFPTRIFGYSRTSSQGLCPSLVAFIQDPFFEYRSLIPATLDQPSGSMFHRNFRPSCRAQFRQNNNEIRIFTHDRDITHSLLFL